MRKVQLTIKQEEVAPATTSDLVVMNNGKTLKEELSTNVLDKFSREVTVDTSMSKVIDGTLDGVYESGVMYGRSLVNIKKTVEAITMTGSGQYKVFHLRSTDIIQDLKTDTDYLFVVNVTSNTLEGSTKYSLDFGNTDPNNPNQQTHFTARHYLPYNALGTYKFVLRTKSSFENAVFVSRNQILPSCTGGGITFSYMLLEYQEGMENWDIPFFGGICDVKMPILRNVGKNLLNPQSITYTFSHTSTEIKMKNSLKPNVKYTISFDRNGISWAGRSFYVKGEGFSSYRTTQDFDSKRAGITFSLTDEEVNVLNNDDKSFLQLYSALVTSKSLRPTNIQIEESSTRTVYEDHKTNILRTSEEIVLREVGGVCDTYNVLTGEYTQRIGEGQFCGDGLTAYAENETYSGAYYLHSNSMSDSPLLSPTMKNLTVTEWKSMSCEGIYKGSSGIGVVVNISKLSQSNLTGLKAYFTQNPVTFQYQLAEPITTIVEPLTIPFAYENGHIILESWSEEQSLLPELKYSAPASKSGVLSTTSKTILKHEQRLHKFEDLLLRESILMDYRLTLSFLDKM